ncbi:coth protein-domain-containing protein [Cunninghamella echinulata]|nr:coth protein-domain-containing protein [Cunninghamella echinulata]
MKFFKTALVAILSFIILASCQTNTINKNNNRNNVNYKVISTSSQHNMGVLVKGRFYPLQSTPDVPILYTGSAPYGNYRYVKLSQNKTCIIEQENFIRHKQTEIPNEFYNRSWNTKQLKPLPTILNNLPSVHRLDSPLHQENTISTIYIKADQKQVDVMHGDPQTETEVKVDLTLIENNKVQTFKDVEISLSGRSSRWTSKQSYSIKLPKGQELYGYRRLKLRALAYDPAYIREKLSTDIMKSAGLPSTGSSYKRVIINDRPIGLFLMVENYKNPWFKNLFADGGKMDQGITFEAKASISDLSYFGAQNLTLYEKAYEIEEDPDNKDEKNYNKLIAFTKFLSEAPTGEGAETVWNQQIDMESVIRSLAIEVVAGFSDGYIGNANNYHLYDHLQEKRFIFIKSDFDNTFGNTLVDLSQQWTGDYLDCPGFTMRPLTTKMLLVPAFKQRFEEVLQLLVQQLINPKAMNPRIDSLINMIRQDVQWDQTLPRVSNATWDDADGTEFETDDPPAPLDGETIKDFKTRPAIPLDKAVNGPTGHPSLAGVKEWIRVIHKNINAYFN